MCYGFRNAPESSDGALAYGITHPTEIFSEIKYDSYISQAINKTVYVLIFNSHTDHEGIHTIFFNGRNKVLMFESASDAKDFAKNLIREKPADLNVPILVVEAFNSQEIITFCQTAGYDYELISAGGKIEREHPLSAEILKQQVNH
ncbi:DUF3110 domain-containing protein [Nostoc sphaeroides CHAB 2801]|uniref:DUF3110 domain-containing protein n=1 Tax=Nostoc sphaeroides TaxID=446679 RepID=UPI001E2838D9|nr:DUF3110 domain-containing protein [Nostoc sphaeroides]MCC5633647.1 DUF3110 domain-containing protein [Nostoc sphaeroides CHAB 2801]